MADKTPKFTPMMEQYMSIKQQYKYCLLFYRLGDFYEMFFDDAVIASRELEITLTGKDCGMAERAPMCGVPFHSADGYIARLIEKGYKVAICEQTENPKNAKGIVKRDVVRVITPGTVLDTKVLDEGRNNYIMAVFQCDSGFGISACDVTTGELFAVSFSADEENKVIDEIARILPSEIICNGGFSMTKRIESIFGIKADTYNNWCFDYQNASICLCNHFNTLNLAGFGLDDDRLCVPAAGALMSYLIETQKNALEHISSIKKYTQNRFMVLDIGSRRNLELTRTIRDKGKKGSLLWVLDKTKTAMGARLLRSWIEQPLIDSDEIDKRLGGVEAFKNNIFDREELREAISSIYDIERLMSKVIYSGANARELVALKQSFEHIPHIKNMLKNFDCDYVRELYRDIDDLDDMYGLISSGIEDNPPVSLREGGIIKTGYSKDVDALREAKEKGSSWLADLEVEERKKTGIKNLKIRFNRVFGYYIEVLNSYRELVPERYIRKQTLANCERYITPELKKIEDTILGADEKVVVLEYDIFNDIRKKIAGNVDRIMKTAAAISVVDVLQSLGETADKNGYVRPVVKDDCKINIINGRHPVVEKLGSEEFIPNDTLLDDDKNRLAIITGPNMAGKSTYMRQIALIVLMAQIGSFVPADSAEIGITDRIFTRVGASDDLATGQSTFMIEMTEVANILNNATKKSLLILDEIGRGTSTYDGLSIAWAVLEYIADKNRIGARTLFATHYHELTELENKIDGVNNYSVSVMEKGENIIFLRKIIRGGADRSYGIHVAQLAGVPRSVIRRSKEILELIDRGEDSKSGDGFNADYVYKQKPYNRKMIALDELNDEFENMNIDSITPIKALEKLYEIKNRLKELEVYIEEE